MSFTALAFALSWAAGPARGAENPTLLCFALLCDPPHATRLPFCIPFPSSRAHSSHGRLVATVSECSLDPPQQTTIRYDDDGASCLPALSLPPMTHGAPEHPIATPLVKASECTLDPARYNDNDVRPTIYCKHGVLFPCNKHDATRALLLATMRYDEMSCLLAYLRTCLLVCLSACIHNSGYSREPCIRRARHACTKNRMRGT
jgi:hypothetical protein